MSESTYRRLFITLACILHLNNACQMDGVTNWLVPVQVSVRDVHRGTFFTADTTNIIDISSITHAEGLNSGPYIDIQLEGSQFAISTNDAFAQYEENETASSMGVTVNMRCSDGTGFLVFMINVIDTNNNAPQFKPSNELEFTIAPPVPPGFLITGCLDDIIARDIDLTTQRVEFEIDENPYLEISYDAASSMVAKEFKAILRTTNFIRALPEPVTVRIRATDVDLTGDPPLTTEATLRIIGDSEFELPEEPDVDLTGDPPLTTEATLRIIGDSEFELPEEPVFSQTFYLADISGGQLQHEPISLLQGYSSEIIFKLDETEYSEFFNISWMGNQVSIRIQSTLPDDMLHLTQIYLVLKVERNFTSGASATVILQMPEPRQLSFERDTYNGNIRDNALTLDPIVLNIGYGEDVEFEVNSDFEYFKVSKNGNQAILSIQTQIPDNIIQENDFFMLSISASGTNTASTSAIVILQILKDDLMTPVFSKHSYVGTYLGPNNLVLEDIMLAQGFDNTVRFQLEGKYREYFSQSNEGNNVTLSLTSNIPEDVIFDEKSLVLNIRAEKDLTVGASASIIINFPRELTELVEMTFAKNSYLGFLENGELSLETISLTKGFINGVMFNISGEHKDFFRLADSNDNNINVEILNEISENVVANNNFLTFEVIATRERAVTAVANVVIDIVKQEVASPTILQFSRKTYIGSISNNVAQIPRLSLQEPFSGVLNLTITGEYESYFNIVQENSQFIVSLPNNLPDEVLTNTFITLDVEAAHINAISGYATIVLEIVKESTPLTPVFERAYYTGQYSNQDGLLFEHTIQLIQGYEENVNFTLVGDDSGWFRIVQIGNNAILTIDDGINEIKDRSHLVFSVVAEKSGTLNGQTAIVIALTDTSTATSLKFSQSYYVGSIENDSLSLENINLDEGYSQDLNVTFGGEYSEYFELKHENGIFSLTLKSVIPAEITDANNVLINTLEVRNGNVTAHTVIVIDLVKINNMVEILNFEEKYYSGSYLEETGLNFEVQIKLQGNISESTAFSLDGENSQWFSLSNVDNALTITNNDTIPEAVLENNQYLVFFIIATKGGAVSASTTIVIYLETGTPSSEVNFSKNVFEGRIQNGELQHETISIMGYEETEIPLFGEYAGLFSGTVVNGVVAIRSTGSLTFPEQVSYVALEMRAGAAYAVVILEIVSSDTSTAVSLKFSQSYYVGSIENDSLSLENINLDEGYSQDLNVTFGGEYSEYFELKHENGIFSLTLKSVIPAEITDANNVLINTLEVRNGNVTAHTVIVIDLVKINNMVEILNFEEKYYSGSYLEETGLNFEEQIKLQGNISESIAFSLDGENSQWFSLINVDNALTITINDTIPEAVLENNQYLVFFIIATKGGAVSASTTIVIYLETGTPSSDVNFSKNVFEGRIQNGELQHETITIMGYEETEIPLFGEYAGLFSGTVANGVVAIRSTGSLTFPEQVSYVALEMRAGAAYAVVILEIVSSETPTLPTVSFSSPSYVFRVEIDQTGVIGQVQATADNGEALTYSPVIENVHLQQRLSITSEGNVQLTAPVNSGIYSFQVIATTEVSRVEGNTTVQLFVEAASICGNDIVVPPLLILDRDEEEPHANLVVLDGSQFAACQYILTNRWPENQSWLYVDENGLHTKSIDREHESIAFMALSQVQVELVLLCANDSNDITRFKRDVTPRFDWLGPNDYGNNKWILTDTIHYNSRRTLVNLIVNDINDNAPIFIGKDKEPIAVGYPKEELERSILPRALAELTATDADIGENAALRYWSSNNTLSVAPTTGFVHVRNGAQLEHGSRLTVYATDRNGDGLTGSIELVVRLLDVSHIVVVTVQDVFLNDESTILNELSTAVGYEVKALRSEIVSNYLPQSDVRSRIKRELTSTNGTSLQIYVYGLIEREPVAVDKLTTDIINNTITVNIASTVSLEDHLISQEKHSGRDTGLLVSTIVLSVLFFILIVALAIWYILKWRKDNYDNFTDENSLSRNDSVQELPKLEPPRLNIEELKRSERRLQEMLDAPVEEKEDAVVNIITFDPATPIVVKDKLKAADESDDEFGEKQKDRRKSVVTFNENVEKIIHVEDNNDAESLPDYEVYRF